jgi:hypothetical protein
MTTPKKRRRAAATESMATPHATEAIPTASAAAVEPPQSASARVEAAATLSPLISEGAACDAPSVNESEAAGPSVASITTAQTTPAASLPVPTVSSAKKLSALDAAVKVLGETGQAMSCQELIAAMAAHGYWRSPTGRTPASTLYAAVLRELKSKGPDARFIKTHRGKFALRTTP